MLEAIKPHEWPERLKLRDTKVIADEGQRILTNATGYGYEQQTYVRADKFDALKAENERLKKDNYSYARTMDAIAIVDAEAAPSPSPAPGVVEELLSDLATRPIIDGINYRALFRDFQERASRLPLSPRQGTGRG